MKKRSGIIALLGVLALLAAATAGFLFLTQTGAYYDNIAALQQASGLAVVLPKQLPQGASVSDQPRYDAETGVIITRLSVSGNGVTISQQKRPETDLNQIDAQDTFLVNAGSVYVLKGETGQLQAIVETSDSWLMINANAALGTGTFRTLLESLSIISQ